jgi:hypothetical protein
MYTVSTDVVQLYQTFTIPNIFISLHTDGSLVVWEWSENRPLLKLSLPQSYTLTDKIIVTSDSVVAVCKASITTDFEVCYNNNFIENQYYVRVYNEKRVSYSK